MNKTLGITGIAEYHVWRSMKARCCNSNDKRFSSYGGRGIKVCKKWKDSFISFIEDMGRRPTDQHSIDRINNDGNYCPNNCRWATREEQARNKSSRGTHFITLNKETHCVKEWSQLMGIDDRLIHRRLRLGWSEEKAITTPVKKMQRRKILSMKEISEIKRIKRTQTMTKTAIEFGVSLTTVHNIVFGITYKAVT